MVGCNNFGKLFKIVLVDKLINVGWKFVSFFNFINIKVLKNNWFVVWLLLVFIGKILLFDFLYNNL